MTSIDATPSELDRAADLVAQQRKIVNRLRRAEGQLGAVIKAVESGAECRDIVIQLSAVSKALDRAGYAIVASAMRNCIADPRGQLDDAGRTREAVPDSGLSLDQRRITERTAGRRIRWTARARALRSAGIWGPRA